MFFKACRSESSATCRYRHVTSSFFLLTSQRPARVMRRAKKPWRNTSYAWRGPRQVKSSTDIRDRDLRGRRGLVDLLQNVTNEVQDEALAVRMHEKQVEAAATLKVRRPLPLSPLMDPASIAARQRHRTPKPRQGSDLTPFQRKLQSNPYAQALATPVRKCIFTGVRIPTFFQIKFNAVNHPKTGAPWFIPDEQVIPETPPKTSTANKPDNDRDVDESEDAQIAPTSAQPARAPPKRGHSSIHSSSSGAYVLARKNVLQTLTQQTRRVGEIQKLVPRRWRDQSNLHVKEMVWREDMDTYFLDILRRTVLGKLKYLFHRTSGYITKSSIEGMEGIQKSKDLGSILWLGGAGNSPSPGLGRKPPSVFPAEGPAPYLMLKYQGHHIPVYNLRTMLGAEILQALRESSEIFDGEFVMLKEKANTVKTQMLLWRLQLYISHSEVEAKEV